MDRRDSDGDFGGEGRGGKWCRGWEMGEGEVGVGGLVVVDTVGGNEDEGVVVVVMEP